MKTLFCFVCFLQLILLFPPFLYHFFSWRWPKVSLHCSVPMFFGVLHYLQFKRDFIWNPFLPWHLSTITIDSAGDYGMLPNLSITKYSNDRTISIASFIVMGALEPRTSVDDALLWGDLLLEGHRLCNTLVWGQQFCTACVALQLLPNYSSHHPNLSKHDGSCSFATAAKPHWQVTMQRNLPMLMLMGDTPVTWWRHVWAPQAFFS